MVKLRENEESISALNNVIRLMTDRIVSSKKSVDKLQTEIINEHLEKIDQLKLQQVKLSRDLENLIYPKSEAIKLKMKHIKERISNSKTQREEVFSLINGITLDNQQIEIELNLKKFLNEDLKVDMGHLVVIERNLVALKPKHKEQKFVFEKVCMKNYNNSMNKKM